VEPSTRNFDRIVITLASSRIAHRRG
jgi:hypothetical protein